MKKIEFKRTRSTPNLSEKKNRILFLALNFVLIIGGVSLISTFLYLIYNLDKADEILIYCLPVICFGVVLIVGSAFGLYKLRGTKKPPRIKKSISFGR